MLVDSHCHLNFPEFKDDLDQVIQNAHNAGVTHMMTVNTRLSEANDIQTIADAYPNVFCSVGVHPHDAKDYTDTEHLKSELSHLSQHPKVIALGETGLDYYYNNSPREDQINAFKAHMHVSLEKDLPLIIHTRDADADTLATLKSSNQMPHGVFHCFSGGMELARAALDIGFYLSFSGIITFKKADDLREVVAFCPMDRMLVETDAPFLAPLPHRGRRNEPAYTRITAEKVAEVKGVSLDVIAKHTTDNFFTLFNRATR